MNEEGLISMYPPVIIRDRETQVEEDLFFLTDDSLIDVEAFTLYGMGAPKNYEISIGNVVVLLGMMTVLVMAVVLLWGRSN